MSKLITYEIKFKRFIDGVWDGQFRKASISAENEYQAMFQHGQTNGVEFPAQNVEDIIVMVQSQNFNPKYFEVGRTYETVSGDKVKMVEFKDLPNKGRTNYETIMDEHGHHRYSRRELGRCTGSRSNNPANIQLGVFWQRFDPEDPYDYIMERKEEPSWSTQNS